MPAPARRWRSRPGRSRRPRRPARRRRCSGPISRSSSTQPVPGVLPVQVDQPAELRVADLERARPGRSGRSPGPRRRPATRPPGDRGSPAPPSTWTRRRSRGRRGRRASLQDSSSPPAAASSVGRSAAQAPSAEAPPRGRPRGGGRAPSAADPAHRRARTGSVATNSVTAAARSAATSAGAGSTGASIGPGHAGQHQHERDPEGGGHGPVGVGPVADDDVGPRAVDRRARPAQPGWPRPWARGACRRSIGSASVARTIEARMAPAPGARPSGVG